MAYENIRYEQSGAVATITVAREKALNALNAQTLQEIGRALEEAESAAAIRVVIVTGAGEKAFVAGADIAQMVELGTIEARHFTAIGHRVGDFMEAMSKPIIAAVNGFAFGGGLELALACDFIYAADTAKLGQPEVKLGVICGFGGTQRLPRRVGFARAMELILTGDTISAEEAKQMGLVNKVFPAAELMSKVRATAEKIAALPPLAVAASKRAVRRTETLDIHAGCELEAELFSRLFSSKDQKEGMQAFLQKRAPNYEGR